MALAWSSLAGAQNYEARAFRLVPSSGTPTGLSVPGSIGLWSRTSDAHPMLRMGGVDYDMLYTLGGLSVSSSFPGDGYSLQWNNGASQWQPQAVTQTYDVRNFASFAAAVSAIGSTPATLTVQNTQIVSASVSIPSTLTLEFRGAGRLSIATGQTVTINGPLVAPINQIFTGAGSVYFGSSSPSLQVYPQWWGAVADGNFGAHTGTDNQPFFASALNSLRDTGGQVVLVAGEYAVNSSVIVLASAQHPYANISIVGHGYSSHIFPLQPLGNRDGSHPVVRFVGFANFGLKYVGVRSVRISGYDRTTSADPVVEWINTDHGFIIDSYVDNSCCEAIYWNSPNSDSNAYVHGNYVTLTGGYGVTPAYGQLSAYNINAAGATITDNQAYQVGMGMETAGSDYIIQGNRISYCSTGVPGSATWTRGLSLESTMAGARLNVTGNIIQWTGAAITVSTASGSGDSIVSSNTLSNNDDNIRIANTAGTVNVIGNTCYDVATSGAGSGACVAHVNGSTAPLVAQNNIITTGTTGTLAYGVLINDASQNDVVEGNKIFGDCCNSYPFAFASTGAYNARAAHNTIVPLTMPATRNRYLWQGVGLNKTNFAGIDNGDTVLATVIPSRIYVTAAPTIGTWSVGDGAWNISPTTTGVDHWVCTSAGTPGTWTPVYTAYTGTAPVSITSGAVSVASMGGASAGAGGSAGLVPAPSAGQQGNCLHGDSTWGSCGGNSGPYTAYVSAGSSAAVSSVTTGTTDGCGASPTPLQCYTIPGGTLTSDGQKMDFEVGFTTAANADSKTAATQFNGFNVFNFSGTASATTISAQGRIIRTGSASATVIVWYVTSAGASGPVTTTFASGVNWASGIVLKNTVTGATANGDMTANYLRAAMWP